MPLVEANGLSLSTTRIGEGPPVVMLHGLLVGSSASWWFTSAPALARSHEVMLYDLRGHGRSAKPARGYDVATMARDLDALLDATFGPRPVALVGHSYGALVALRYALDHPARVSRLGLVEAPLPPSRLDELQAFSALSPEQMTQALPTVMRQFLDRRGRQAERLMRSLQFLLFESTLLADISAEPDLADAELARLAMPTLCVYGEDSSCQEVGERLARVVPGARLALLPGGHNVHLDASAALTRELLDFLG